MNKEGVPEALAGLHTKVWWTQPYYKAAAQWWSQAMPRLIVAGNKYGFENVRTVFGFDS